MVFAGELGYKSFQSGRSGILEEFRNFALLLLVDQ